MFKTTLSPSAIYDPRQVSDFDCAAFKRVQVLMEPLGGHKIAWELNDGFNYPGPYHFYVDFGRSASHDEWEVLNSSPIVDECLFSDYKQRHWDSLADFYYRVRLVLPTIVDELTGLPKVFYSHPQQANGIWSKNDWLIARDICRKEYLVQKKRTNLTSQGYLLKRRRWGQLCDKCREFDTGQVQNSRCSSCYGTGYVGGYFKAVDFTVTCDGGWSRGFQLSIDTNVTNIVQKIGRAVAYPYLDTRDVYVRRDNGERYIIGKIKSLAELGGIPLVVSTELLLAPVTDIVYNIPLSGGSSSISSLSSALEVPESNVGINADEWM